MNHSPISGSHGLGLGDLLDAAVKAFPEDKGDEEDKDIIKFSFIGRPKRREIKLSERDAWRRTCDCIECCRNARDAIDTTFEDEEGTVFKMIDTAGIRKKGRVFESTENIVYFVP